MSAVSTTEAWPARGQPFTVSDLDRLLAVEIRPPSTALIDLNRKKAAYQHFGVPSHWIVDPDPQEPSVTAFELRDARYATVGKATGRETPAAERPFRVEVIPAALLAGLPGQLL